MCLAAGVSEHRRPGISVTLFLDVGRDYVERDAELGKYRAPLRRARR